MTPTLYVACRACYAVQAVEYREAVGDDLAGPCGKCGAERAMLAGTRSALELAGIDSEHFDTAEAGA